MKKIISTLMLGFLVTAGTILKAQNQPDEYLGLPGDNLNLYAVMNLFQESETLEEFERKLNDPDSRINNLDLNGDNLVDYITVHDYVKGKDHNIVLRVALNNNEKQDLGVFTVEKLRNGSVQIQLVGDEALYGNNYIIEPIYDGVTPNPGYTGNNITYVRTTTYEVAAWPMIRYIYNPYYTVWHSNWYWGYYPSYWNPWRPYYYHHYYGYHHNYYPVYYRHYHHANHHRYNHYNDYYYSNVRSHSPYVSSRIKEGHYKTTYSRPESRRDGEALYARSHNERRTETAANKSINNRRSTYNENRSSQGSNNTVTRERESKSYQGENTARSNRSINERRAVSNERTTQRSAVSRTTGNEKKSTSNERRATGNEKKSTTIDRKATNNEKATSTASKSTRKIESSLPYQNNRNNARSNPSINSRTAMGKSSPARTESMNRTSRSSSVNHSQARSERPAATASPRSTPQRSESSGQAKSSSAPAKSGRNERSETSNDTRRPGR